MFEVDVNGRKQRYRSKPTMNVDTTGSSGDVSIPKPLTYDYMPEGYPSKDIEYVTLMEEQEVSSFTKVGNGIMGAVSPVVLELADGDKLTVVWDGVSYDAVVTMVRGQFPAFGNLGLAGMGDVTDYPFVYLKVEDPMWGTADTATSHTIKVTTIGTVYQTMDENFLPQPPRQVRILDTTRSYSTKEVEEIYQSVLDGTAIYWVNREVITYISYNPHSNFSFGFSNGQREIIRPVDGVWDFTNRETTYPSSITFDSFYGDYAEITGDINGVGGIDRQGYELIGTNMAGFKGDYIQAYYSIVLKLRDAPYYLYISATTNGEIEIEKRGSGLASGGETTTLFKNGDRSMILKSSTEGSTKKFKITVDDSGTISATEVT